MTTTDARVYLEVPAPCSLLNANHRRHWRVKARMVKAWRRAAAGEAGMLPPVPTPVRVTMIVHRHHDRGFYDASNYADTGKAILDGIVDAGVLPDDRNAYVVGPDMRQGEPWPAGGITVVLDPLDLELDKTPILPPFAVKGDPLWNR